MQRLGASRRAGVRVGRRYVRRRDLYRAHCHGTEPATIVPFDHFTVDDGGVEITGTSCRSFWND